MSATDLFEEFSRFGDRILEGINKNERAARKYKYLLGEINELLQKTHGIVVERIEKIEKSTEKIEANAALAELRSKALEESFRMEGLCDVFDAFGRTLNEMAWNSKQQGDSVAGDLGAVNKFAVKLMDREREVASIYTEEIKAMVNLGSAGGDLASLRKRATAAKVLLTNQMADFAAKAERFKRVSK